MQATYHLYRPASYISPLPLTLEYLNVYSSSSNPTSTHYVLAMHLPCTSKHLPCTTVCYVQSCPPFPPVATRADAPPDRRGEIERLPGRPQGNPSLLATTRYSLIGRLCGRPQGHPITPLYYSLLTTRETVWRASRQTRPHTIPSDARHKLGLAKRPPHPTPIMPTRPHQTPPTYPQGISASSAIR